jgi:hypothetical protein
MPRFTSLVLLSRFLLVSGWTQSQHYLPLTENELGSPLRLKRIAQLVHSEPTQITTVAGVSGAMYRIAPTDFVLTLSGNDKEGKPWSVDLFQVGCGAPRLYESDLDKDGTVDAVIVNNTCGNGLAPSSHVVAVTFDETGRPIPFEAEGYFLEANDGIDALVDLDRNGLADLVFMNFSDGYWITNIYSISKGRWNRITGEFAHRRFPVFTRFTHRPNKMPVKPPANRFPYAPNLSNMSPVHEGRLVAWSWPDQKREYNLKLTVAKADGSTITCTPNYWYDSARLLLDLPSGRKIGHLSDPERARVEPLLAEAVKGQFQVKLYGERYPDRCSPELVWASGK